jgi:hypothetical protein
MFAYWADQIRALNDANGVSLLESTLMYWGWEYAERNHDHVGTTSILVGKANGRLNTGLHLDCIGEITTKGTYQTYDSLPPVNKLFVTILQALGLNQSQIEVSGQAGFGEYGTLDITSNDHRTNNIGFTNKNRSQWYTDVEKRKPLPLLKV